MARLRMKTNVTVNGKGWSARYLVGRYYSANHAEFLPAEAYDLVEDKKIEDLYSFDEPRLDDAEKGIE